MPARSAPGAGGGHRATATTRPATGEKSLPTPNVLLLLLALRIVSALTLRTFFQPDEYFQSLEPAWQLAFGQHAGAWITWEWRAQLRSSLHPALFAAVYQFAATLANLCQASPRLRAELLVAAPKVVQAVIAALLDCYTWRLAQKIYGRSSRTAWVTLALSVFSPWQWFCAPRTLSNCLETTITSIAVYYWPWRWADLSSNSTLKDKDIRNHGHPASNAVGALSKLRLSLLLAAVACILRPTNALIWLCLAVPTLWRATTRGRFVLVREVLACGSAILVLSVLSDRLFYGFWTLPPVRFLYFNIAQSLAVFYGRNRPDYYLTEGIPLLLTTALPFAAVGIWQNLPKPTAFAAPRDARDAFTRTVLGRLACTSITVAVVMSLISHKEVRFLYPVLPFLHVLAAGPLCAFSNSLTASRKAILAVLLSLNLIIAGYVSQVHQRGVIDVMSYLRHQYEAQQLEPFDVGFLMPCHSTPWRSHLVHPGIHAWALTCEPPIDVPLSERGAYLDEADQFYIEPGPSGWINKHMADLRTVSADSISEGADEGNAFVSTNRGLRAWPQYLVFFEQLEETTTEVLQGTRYTECWRGFNTHFHDDSRRRGDVIVWCLER
ncbi:uncharacterized protein BDZ99DRAFT_571427 [Mytilinidion resinicola]|uniref:Mannosyltransferase n=1 Tax=Mytilinidion resinicola TaxID=574789 RepID=A0A6A6YM71_9PEZI|nr:uncharacterized protein BDZ99DRAFT_571427 [Mytilinidion resinicola]KAF2809649.1 hypothetical protein BDZ99DRAFT_571427 [Mytilinidion resinicola]